MNASRLARLLIALEALVLVGLALHTPVTVWLETIWPQHGDLLKAWKEIVMGVCLALVVALVTMRRWWRRVLRDRLVQAVAAYGLLHCGLLLWRSQGFAAATAGMLIDLRYILFFVLVYVTVLLYPSARRVLLTAAGAGAVIILGFALLQVTVLPPDVLAAIGYSKTTILPYLTVDQNHDFIRINSTLRGPNPLGAYAGAALALLAAYAVRHRRVMHRQQWIVLSVCITISIMAVWVSYSRSALVAAAVALLAVLAIALFGSVQRVRWWLLGGALCVVLAIGGVAAARETPFVSNVFFHDNQVSGSAHKSDDGHASSLRDGMAEVASEPLGNGIGSTGSASLRGSESRIIENQYLFTAHESGWLGLALYSVIFVIGMIGAWRRRADWLALGVFGSGVGLALIGLLLPVWADDTVSIVWWALLATALATRLSAAQKGDGHDRKKRTRK